MKKKKRTNASVIKYDHETGVIDPLNSESTCDILPVRKCTLDVLGFEFLGETGETEDTGNRRREWGELGRHFIK